MRNASIVSVTKSCIFAVIGCLVAWASPAASQSTGPPSQMTEPRTSCLRSIDPARVSHDHTLTVLRRDGGTLRGHLYELNENEISIRPVTSGVTTVTVPLENVATLSYSRIGEKKPSKVVLWAAIGAVVGFAIGYSMSDPDEPDPNDFFTIPEETQRTASGLVFGVIGAGLGALVGVGMSAPDVTPVEVQCAPVAP